MGSNDVYDDIFDDEPIRKSNYDYEAGNEKLKISSGDLKKLRSLHGKEKKQFMKELREKYK